MTEIPDKTYFTASEVARLLLVSTNSVRVWTNKGLLKTELTLGGHRRFPRHEIERLVRERQGQTFPSMRKSLRILIIDDDEVFNEIITKALEHALPEAVVASASDGFSGGMLARSFNPEIILLDLRMPGQDGFQVCRMLKADEATQSIRIIAISGSASEADKQNITGAGAEDLLVKPFDIPTLLDAIAKGNAGAQVAASR